MNGKDQRLIRKGVGREDLKNRLQRRVWELEKMVAGVWTLGWLSFLSFPSLSFPSPSLLSCQTRSSAGLLGAFFVPLHSSLTILPICSWVRSEIEGAKEQQTARAGEGETREVRICPLKARREGAILKSWEQSVLQFPLPHLHYCSFSPFFFEPWFSSSMLFSEMGKRKWSFSKIVLFLWLKEYTPLPVPTVIPLA